jgi:hypothetical protein
VKKVMEKAAKEILFWDSFFFFSICVEQEQKSACVFCVCDDTDLKVQNITCLSVVDVRMGCCHALTSARTVCHVVMCFAAHVCLLMFNHIDGLCFLVFCNTTGQLLPPITLVLIVFFYFSSIIVYDCVQKFS